MKKILLILLIFASTGIFAQGTLRVDGKDLRVIPQYDLSNGDSEWVVDLTHPQNSFKWGIQFTFSSLAGTKDGTLTVYVSMDDGANWVAYPNMASQTISADGTYTFDDKYSIYDQIKIALTVNSITGGAVDVNQRLITNPKK